MRIEIIRNKRNEEAFDKLLWVLRARTKDEGRPNCDGLRIEMTAEGEWQFIATDGWRLHTAIINFPVPRHSFETGFYTILKGSSKKHLYLESTTEYEFPDWKKIAQDRKAPLMANLRLEKTPLGSSPDGDKLVWEVFRAGQFFNSQFLKDAYMDGQGMTVEVVDMKHNRPSVFTSEDGRQVAYVMPKRLNGRY